MTNSIAKLKSKVKLRHWSRRLHRPHSHSTFYDIMAVWLLHISLQFPEISWKLNACTNSGYKVLLSLAWMWPGNED